MPESLFQQRSRGILSVMDPKQIVQSDPDILGGTLVFAGTRVPVHALIDSIEAGETIDQFLENYPGVSRAQVIAFFEVGSRALLAKIDQGLKASENGDFISDEEIEHRIARFHPS